MIATIALLFSLQAATAAPPGDAAERHFERRIRPALLKHCVSCHGPKKQESGLRVDSRQALLKGGDRGPALNLKQPRKSLLLTAIARQGDLKMPPKMALKPNEIADFRRWIAGGAAWPRSSKTERTGADVKRHWAFQPVRRPAVPRLLHGRQRNAIDSFVIQRQRPAKLRLAPRATRRELIRRATFDLLGLPPTPTEVATFLADKSPHAFDKLVDRLLASPRYGERWGRHWLDVARYADNRGYVFFIGANFPWSYTYRDYVIRSLNRDVPYDRFIKEQLAADLIDRQGDPGQLAGMGFITIGAQFMNNVHDITDDRIDVITRGLLAITVTCARCHDHKFDPIPQADYYSLYGILRSSEEPLIPPLIQAPPTTKAYKKFDAELKKRSRELDRYIRERFGSLVNGARRRVNEYLMAVYKQQNQPDQDDFMLLVDKDDVNPTMVIRWRHYLRKQADDDPVWAPWNGLRKVAADSFRRRAIALARKLRGTINPIVGRQVLTPPPRTLQDLADRYGKLFKSIDVKYQQLIKANAAARLSPAEEQIRHHIYGHSAPPTIPIKVGWGFLAIFPDRATQGEFKKRQKALEDWIERGPAAPPRAMSLAEAKTPFRPRIFLRGNSHRKGKEVPRQFLKVLSPANRQPFAKGSGRLELAQAIASRNNPLTARVIVNRLWKHHFGQGLVSTPSDFGLRSSPPSHPDLLDYLANWLVDHDWSLKSLHRFIMTSAVYQQSSRYDAGSFERDPTNRLLWRFSRRRLDFESMRDALLAVADQLDFRLGGKPIKLHARSQVIPRRSVYGFINRMDVSALMTTFDFPNPQATSPGRVNTTVAPQALYFMNNAFVRAVSQKLVQQTLMKSREKTLHEIYQRLFARTAEPDEVILAHSFLGKEPKKSDWVKLVQALLMTNEFVFVD